MARTAPNGWKTPLAQAPPRGARPGFITAQETYWHEYVRRRLRSLTRALALVLAVAGVALGIAVGLLLSELHQRDVESAHATALEQRVTRLEARIEQLQRRSQER